jgi:hypothetical protein
MPVQIAEDTTALRAKEKPLAIPVNLNDEKQGTVELKLCELPSGLLEELEGEISELGTRITEKNQNLASARRLLFLVENQITNAKEEDYASLTRELKRLTERCKELREERQGLKAERRGKQMELIAWGVCDHNQKDFLVGEREVPFKPEIGVYDGIQYRIASLATIRQYLSVGTDFVDCVYMYVTNFQRQVVLSARKVWDETKKTKERIDKKIEALLQNELNKAIQNATEDTTPEDRLAEAGGELGAEELDPNAKRAQATATPEL